jgi:hypothetical protein
LTINLALKAAFVLLLLHAVVFPDLPQYQGKGIGWSLYLYPISSILAPLVWLVVRRRRDHTTDYPYLIDIFIGLPFLIDTAGKAVNAYDSVDWWDDAMHFLTWVPWVLAFGLAARRRPNLRRFDVAAITIGFGAATHIVWESLEYVAFIGDNPTSATRHIETLWRPHHVATRIDHRGCPGREGSLGLSGALAPRWRAGKRVARGSGEP